jgi:hypothetical protein
MILMPFKRTKGGSPANYLLKVLIVGLSGERGQYRRIGRLRCQVPRDLEMHESHLQSLVCHLDELQCVETNIDEDRKKRFTIDLI